MEEQWRWLLVDALAHGRRWYNPTHASIVQKPEYTALYEQYEEEPNLRTKLALAKILTEKLGRNIEAMYRSFNRSESARILTTPRFDIMDSFMKADIPDSQDEYFPKLPSLAIPFQEFWVEWRW